jgi:signal transduction histidine kinase
MKELKNYNLSKLNLNFENEKIEDDYTKLFSTNLRKFNLYFSLGSFLISLHYLIWMIFLLNNVSQYMQDNFLAIKKIKTEEISLFSNVTQIFYNKFVIINSNYTDSSFDFITYNETINFSNKNSNENYLLVLRFIYTYKAILLCIVVCLIHFILLLFSKFIYKRKFHTLIFNFQFLIFGFMFHIFGANLLMFYNYTSDSMLFLVAFQMFFRTFMIHKAKVNWLNILITSLLIAGIEWPFLLYVHYKMRTIHFLYLGVNDMILLLCIIIAYYSEYHNKINFYLLKRLNFEREYLLNFLFNMEEGFLSFRENKILYVNKSMEEIVKNYSNYSHQLKLNVIENYCTESGRKFSQDNLINLKTENVFLDLKRETKYFIEKILLNLVEINKDLPVEILNLFDKKNQNENFSFDIENFYKILINKETSNLSNFILLGVVDFKNFDFSHNNINSNNDYEPFPKYQISFRIIENMEDGSYFLEMIFSDISRVTHTERQKTINDCRSLYLSKVAHEFKNPLVSLTELSENIQDATEKENYKLEICNQVDHIKMICKIMENFLKDFTTFANLINSCADKKGICQFDSLIKCLTCDLNKLCIKCKICKICDENKKKKFDYTENIIKIKNFFIKLIHYEKKNILFLDNLSSLFTIENSNLLDQYLKFINTKEEIFNSVLFNILYYSYKNTFTGEIQILVENSGLEEVRFCVIDTGLEIDANFIINLENNKLMFEGRLDFENILEFEDTTFSNFNKYFGLFMASSQVRDIGSKLIIETNKFGNKFSFTIPLADREFILEKFSSSKIPHIAQQFANLKRKVELTDKMNFNIKESISLCK